MSIGSRIRSIERWHVQWRWRTPNPVFKVTAFWSRISQKRCILGTKLLKTTNRKRYTVYGMIPLSMTLSDLWPGFQGHHIFWRRISEKRHVLKSKLLLHKRKVYLTYGMMPCFSIVWPVNASCRFVSISWASCYTRDGLHSAIAIASCPSVCHSRNCV